MKKRLVNMPFTLLAAFLIPALANGASDIAPVSTPSCEKSLVVGSLNRIEIEFGKPAVVCLPAGRKIKDFTAVLDREAKPPFPDVDQIAVTAYRTVGVASVSLVYIGKDAPKKDGLELVFLDEHDKAYRLLVQRQVKVDRGTAPIREDLK